MKKPLTMDDIDEKLRSKIYNQDYTKKPTIEEVKIVPLNKIVLEEGDFAELIRINENGDIEGFTGFKIAQINRTRLNAKAIKAWHLHFKQDEIWYVLPSDHLLVGLWDVRKDSKTKGVTQRIVLGGGKSQLVFIPRGVAHGSCNLIERPVELFYFTNKQFDIKNPDEKRIRWDAQGANFWEILKD